MCGLAGFRSFNGSDQREYMLNLVEKMAASMILRGPDDQGVWVDEGVGVALGHRRLAVVDLSKEGHQPMISASGRYVIAYNGEIYNFKELRKELSVQWRGTSDTEVMLAAFDSWGIERALAQFNGMFGFAVWDMQDNILTLARDRMGEKPLYYGWAGDVFLFGSELKPLRKHPHFRRDIDRDALALYMRLGYVPAPHCIYENFYKLMPGQFLQLRDNRKIQVRSYWSLENAMEKGVDQRALYDRESSTQKLHDLLLDSVEKRMVADVPLGAMLSGGIDSSLIVALMQKQSRNKVRTFSIGFDEPRYNEAPYAKAVADHLGTRHTEFYVTPKDALQVIPQIPKMYDEPFADMSQIPTYLVSRLARQNVTVCLTGDAGDELFGGYVRYLWADKIWNKVRWMPKSMRRLGARAVHHFPPGFWDKMSFVMPQDYRYPQFGDKVHKLAELLASDSGEVFYKKLISLWQNPEEVTMDSRENFDSLLDLPVCLQKRSLSEKMMYWDMMTYLPGDILTKVDRASMGVSLETRIPFLDHRVVEFAAGLPMEAKIRQGETKSVLRDILYQYVPRDLIDRPKMGFGVPVDQWLRGDLKEWAQGLLDQQTYFHADHVNAVWQTHLSGQRNSQFALWAVLMFQSWLEAQ